MGTFKCGCIPNLNVFFCNGPLWLKNHDGFNIPQIRIFYTNTNMVLSKYFFLATYIQYKKFFLGKGYGTTCGAIVRNILDAHSWVHFASLHCLNKISIPFCSSSFWVRILQELKYLLWFKLISLYGCHASFWFAIGHFDWPITKKL